MNRRTPSRWRFGLVCCIAGLGLVLGCGTSEDQGPAREELAQQQQPEPQDIRPPAAPDAGLPSKPPPSAEPASPPGPPPDSALPAGPILQPPMPPSAQPAELPPGGPPSSPPEPSPYVPSSRPESPAGYTAEPPRSSGLQPNPLRPGSVLPKESPPEITPKLVPVAPPTAKPPAEKPPAEKPPAAKEPPFDPIAVNGPIFVGWPRPRLALVITGRQDGYMEPCGCAGLDRMKGGMTRRHTLFKTLREDGWPVVGLDVGGIAKGFSPQALAKFQFMVEGMRKMGYDAITLGKADLQLPAEELLALTAPVNNQPSPFVMANVALFGFDAKAVAPLRVIEAGGRRVGITGVLGKQFQKQIHGKELEMIAPEAALAKIVPELKRQADYLVLLAHATREESLELARKFPDFDLVVTAGGGEEPPAEDARIPGSKARLIEVGTKGMNAIVVGLFNDPKKPMRYQRVPLDSRFPASPDMKALMAAYQDQIKAAGFEKLGAREVPHPQAATMGRFVGSEKCAQCHEESYAVWKKSGHSRAFKTLEQADPPRQYDPECVSCHVVGWHPTQFFPYRNGYVSREKTPKLVNVGCENCHGPGEDHVKAEGGSNQAWRDKARKATVITKAEAADPTSKKMNCWSCHDLDNSPAFHFDTYWPKIEHREKDSDGEATP